MANFTEDLFDVFEETEDIEVIPTPIKSRNEDINSSLNEKLV